jgi:stage II sporulation protein D
VRDFLEAEEQWYRWTYEGVISSDVIEDRLKARYEARPDLILTLDKKEDVYVNQDIEKLGNITNIEVTKRLPGGVADELLIETTKDTYLIIGEYNIRYILSDGKSEIIRNDGSVVTVSNLLPSAYFIIEPEISSSGSIETIFLTGGGYGHGVGMSQNGARQAALQGMSCEEILELFYGGLERREVK